MGPGLNPSIADKIFSGFGLQLLSAIIFAPVVVVPLEILLLQLAAGSADVGVTPIKVVLENQF